MTEARPAIPIPLQKRRVVIWMMTVVAALLATRLVPGFLRWHSKWSLAARHVITEVVLTKAMLRGYDADKELLLLRRARLAALDSAVLQGEALAAGTARLAGVVADASDSAEIQLATLQLERAPDDSLSSEPFFRPTVRATIVGDLEGLLMFLSMIERGPTIVSVRELTVTQPDPGIARTKLEALRAEVLVEGLGPRRLSGAR